MKTNVLVLLSGGLDSATVLALYRNCNRHAVGFDYGQPHAVELEYAARIASDEGVPFEVVRLPVIRKVNEVVFAARNAILLSVAASIAAERGIECVAIGCNATDWPRFNDCRPGFMRAMNGALNVYGVSVLAPLLRMSKHEVVQEAKRLGVGATWSCYAPRNEEPCGECLACRVRREAGA